MPRRRSQAFFCWDTKALNNYDDGTVRGSYISSTLSNIPSTVKTKEAMYKYLASQMYFMSRPRVTWSSMTLSAAPNIPILPNDPLMIVDAYLNFSAAGQPIRTATAGDMTYEFGTRGGEGNVFRSNLYLSVQPVGLAINY
jgi:hypothetical protein